MIFPKLHQNYVSDIDRFLQEFDANHPDRSPAQQAEIAKHQRIARLRDEVQPLTCQDLFDFGSET